MTTEDERISTKNKSSLESTNIISNENNNDNYKKDLTNEEALDIQINYLHSPVKSILYSIIENEKIELCEEGKKIDEGIFLYLQNIYNKYYWNEINYILNSINNKILFINDKNKELLQNKKFIERETNTVSQEKIDYFNEKENLDKELEIINVKQNSYISDKVPSLNIKINKNINDNNNQNQKEDLEICKKEKQLEDLKKKYNKIFDDISTYKKQYPIIKNKNNIIQGENMILNEKLKQKQIIWDQIRKENEKIKNVVIKRDYSHFQPENKNNHKTKEKEKKTQNKNIKVSKIGNFLKDFMGNKK